MLCPYITLSFGTLTVPVTLSDSINGFGMIVYASDTISYVPVWFAIVTVTIALYVPTLIGAVVCLFVLNVSVFSSYSAYSIVFISNPISSSFNVTFVTSSSSIPIPFPVYVLSASVVGT